VDKWKGRVFTEGFFTSQVFVEIKNDLNGKSRRQA
jgi:hypothetical protein